MNINIKGVKDAGSPGDERLVLDVIHDDDIGRYVIFDTQSSGVGGVSNRLKKAFWFPDSLVRSGDLIVLYTQPGQPGAQKNKDGSRTYFFYWGLEQPIWTDLGDYAVLLQVNNWDAQPIAS